MDGERGNKRPNYQQVSDVDTRNKHSLTIEENDQLCLIYKGNPIIYILSTKTTSYDKLQSV